MSGDPAEELSENLAEIRRGLAGVRINSAEEWQSVVKLTIDQSTESVKGTRGLDSETALRLQREHVTEVIRELRTKFPQFAPITPTFRDHVPLFRRALARLKE